MATEKQIAAARRNLERARAAQSARARGKPVPRRARGAGAAEERMPDEQFAFPKQRKEPIDDARHVRDAIARFDQVEDATDADRDAAWRRIKAAAKKFDVEVQVRSWRDLMKGGRTGRRGARRA